MVAVDVDDGGGLAVADGQYHAAIATDALDTANDTGKVTFGYLDSLTRFDGIFQVAEENDILVFRFSDTTIVGHRLVGDNLLLAPN